MANKLTLVQTSPAVNPDRNLVSVAVTGNYTNGTADPIDLTKILDPQSVGQVPMNNPGQNPPLVNPAVYSIFANGYYCQVQKTVTNGVTSYGLRWYSSQGNELATGAFPADILAAQLTLEILVALFRQS